MDAEDKSYYVNKGLYEKAQQKREQKLVDKSQTTMFNSIKTSLLTVGIGAISDLEKEVDNGNISEEIFEKIRSTILDRSHAEVRRQRKELNNYKIMWINKKRGDR